MTEFALISENETFFKADGTLASGYQLFIYLAGSSTKATTHTESDGITANPNPIVLDALGQTPSGVYVATGTYKTVLTTDTDTDPPATPLRTRDNITARNDATSAAQSEWVAGPTPTYVDGTSFTLVGDQTSDFHVGRRLKIVDSGGTSYAVISVTAYTSLTTVTVVNDVSVIDSGISAVSYALADANNLTEPHWNSPAEGFHKGSDGTIPVWKSGGWEFVNALALSADAQFYIYHDKVSLATDGTDFVDNWQYRVWYDELYGTADKFLIAEWYEGAAYRQTNYFTAGVYSIGDTVDAKSTSIGANYALAGSHYGASSNLGLSGSMQMSNMASTARESESFMQTVGYPPGVVARAYLVMTRPTTADLLNACKHVKCYPDSGGTLTGRVWLERRYIA